MLNNYVSTLIHQGIGCIGLFRRVEPSVDPNDLEFNVRINLLGTQVHSVDIPNYFGNWERCNIAQGIRFGHQASGCSGDIATFIGHGQIGAKVFTALIPRGMQEGNVGKLLCYPSRRVHESEGGGEDHIIAGLGQTPNGAFSVSTLTHVLHIGGIHLIAKMLFKSQTTQVMLIAPAVIPDGTNVDEANLHGIFCHRGHGHT